MRRSLTAVIGFVFLMSLVGCSTFQGEWLEEGALNPDGSVTPSQGINRMALRFCPPARMQTGQYAESMKVVDGTSVVTDSYYVYEGSKTAQFGQNMARVADKNHIIVQNPGGQQVRYVRVNGKSIFPPDVKINFVSSAAGIEHPGLTEPMLASTAAP